MKGQMSSFTDLSLPTGMHSSWNWWFAEEETSAEQHPKQLYGEAGTYEVTLEVANDHCTARVCQGVDVLSSPALNISSNTTEGCIPPVCGL